MDALMATLSQGTTFPNPKKESEPVIGTLGDIFHAVNFDLPGFSLAFGVDSKKLKEAMTSFLSVFSNPSNQIPGLCAIKLVRKTAATIGFTRFPITAVIHIDGVQLSEAGKKRVGAVEIEIIKAFVRDGIEFTLHWGKNSVWDYNGPYPQLPNKKNNLLETMYPKTAIENWKSQRNKLLGDDKADIFSNDFLERIKLA